MTSTFSMPMRRSSAATNSAALWTSDLCSSSVLTLGMRRRSLSSPKKRCWFWRAKSTAGEAIGVSLSREGRDRLRLDETTQYNRGEGKSVVTGRFKFRVFELQVSKFQGLKDEVRSEVHRTLETPKLRNLE